MLIGEIYLPLPRLLRYYGERLQGMHFPFNFHLILLPEWNAREIRQTVRSLRSGLAARGLAQLGAGQPR